MFFSVHSEEKNGSVMIFLYGLIFKIDIGTIFNNFKTIDYSVNLICVVVVKIIVLFLISIAY